MLNAVEFNFFIFEGENGKKIGRPRWLRFDINTVGDIEVKLGQPIQVFLQNPQFGVNAIRIFLWGGLKHEDPSLTTEKVGALIQKYSVEKGNGIFAISDFETIIIEALIKSGLFGDKTDQVSEAANEIMNENKELGNLKTGEE